MECIVEPNFSTFFTWLPTRLSYKFLDLLDKDMNSNINYYFFKGIQFEFGYNVDKNFNYAMEYYQSGMQKNSYACFLRMFYCNYYGNTGLEISVNKDYAFFMLLKSFAFYREYDFIKEELVPLKIIRTLGKDYESQIIENKYLKKENKILQDYLLMMIKALNPNEDEELIEQLEENNIKEKEALTKSIESLISQKRYNDILIVLNNHRNLVDLGFYGMIWNFLYKNNEIRSYGLIYKDLGENLGIKLKLLNNYRLYAQFLNTNLKSHEDPKKITKIVNYFYMSVLSGNITDIPIALFYFSKYCKLELDTYKGDLFEKFKDLLEIVELFLNRTQVKKNEGNDIISITSDSKERNVSIPNPIHDSFIDFNESKYQELDVFTSDIEIELLISYARIISNGIIEKDFSKVIALLERAVGLIKYLSQPEILRQEKSAKKFRLNYFSFLANYYLGKNYLKLFMLSESNNAFRACLSIDGFSNADKPEIFYLLGKINLFGWGKDKNISSSFDFFNKSKAFRGKNFTIKENYYSHKSVSIINSRDEFKTKIEIDEKKSYNMCKFCMNNEKKTLSIPCGHKFSCESCYDNECFKLEQGMTCESCKAEIENVIKVFY